MHEAVFLGTLYDLQRFLAGDLACSAGADVVLCALAHLDTHVLIEVAAAVAETGAGGSAGAGGDGELVVLI